MSIPFRHRSAWTFVALLALAACSSSSTSGPSVLYSADPTSNQNPVPDARLLGDGGLGARTNAYLPFINSAAVDAPGTNLPAYMNQIAAATADLTGFGNFGGEMIPFSISMNPTTLTSAFSYVFLGTTPAAGPAARVEYNDSPPFARVSPSLPLTPATTYALALTDSAQTATGVTLTRSADFNTWATGAGQAQMAQIASVLGVGVSHIVFAMVFPTQDARSDIESLATWVAQSLPAFDQDAGFNVPSPAIVDCEDAGPLQQCPEGVFSLDAGTLGPIQPFFTEAYDAGVTNSFQTPPVDVGTVVAGTVTLKDARDAEDGHFVASVVANPSTGRDVDRAFVLVLPNPAAQPMPTNGYPLVLVGHGLGGRNTLNLSYQNGQAIPGDSMCATLAEFFTQHGYGCLGIDAPQEGSRGSELSLFNFSDITVTRDYFREMAFDQMQMMRIAASGMLSQYGPAIDPNNLRYFGISLGGIMGSTFLSVDPRSLGGVLNVPGGGLTNIFQSYDIFSDLGLLLQGAPYFDTLFYQADGGVSANFQAPIPYFITLVQALLESADPINYVAAMPTSKHILIQEGLLDETVPNNTNDDLTAAFGVSTLTAALDGDGGVNGRWQFDVTKYGLTPGPNPPDVNPHLIFSMLPEARQQAGDYLQSDDTEIDAE